jgi:hypothetical protein
MFIISPLGSAPVSDSPPYRAALQIPRSDEPGLAVLGRQNVTLVGRSSGKQSPILASIFVDVEKQDLPVSLESDFRHIFFRELGETVHSPRIVGRWADSSSFNLQASSYLALRSSDPALFSLDDRGNMTALAPGKGELYATYFLGSQKVSLAIPVTLPTQILRALPSSFNFGLVELGKASIPIDVVLTNVSGAPQELLTLRLSPIFTETDDCAIPTTLGPGKSCTFTIRWSPKSRSEMGGAMEIALTTGIMKVYLSGSPGDHLP